MKIGTIGTNFIVDAFIDAVNRIDGIEVGACYSRSEDTAQAFATKHCISKTYTDLDAMFHDDELNFIYVASPNSLHHKYSKAALLAGKHVICEKPFTSTVEEAEELIQIAKDNNLLLFEAIMPIHLPNYKWLKENAKLVGTPTIFQCNFSQYSSRYNAFKAGENPNVFNPEFSGGAIMDINIYNLHFVMGIYGKPQSAHYFPNMERRIDTSGILILDYGTFKATCVGAKNSKSENLAQLQGTDGYMIIRSETSRCLSVQSHIGNETITFNQQDIPNGIYYELMDFKAIFENNDLKQCYDLLDYSKDVMEVLTDARKKAGVLFLADK